MNSFKKLEEFPYDILYQIIEYINFKDVLSFTETCKKLSLRDDQAKDRQRLNERMEIHKYAAMQSKITKF